MKHANRLRRLSALVLAVLVSLAAFAGCASVGNEAAVADKPSAVGKNDAGSPMYSAEDEKVSMDAAVETTGGTGGTSLNLGTVDPAQKMVYTVNYSIQTLAFDDSVAALNRLTAELGGYVERSSLRGAPSDGDYYSPRSATYTLRIPAESLQAFLDRVGSVGTVVSESMTGRDVTLEYVDTESRLTALRAQESRIIELLSGATDLQYVLEIERELSDIRYQIESYTSQLKRLDSLVSYSTVEVALSEVYTVTEPRQEPQSFGDKLADTFRASIDRIWGGLQSFAIWLLGNIVEIALWLLLIGVCVTVPVVLVKRAIKKRRKPTPPIPPQPPEHMG